MKTFFFHLMPYADLDLSYTERHNSAWVTLPNSYFDPDGRGEALSTAISASSSSPISSASTASASTSTTRPPTA